MKENVIVKKSYEFAVNSLKAVRSLSKSVENYVLVKQFIRAAPLSVQILRNRRAEKVRKISCINYIYLIKKPKSASIGFD